MDHSQFLAFLENACTLTNEQVTLLKTALEDRKPSSVGQSKLMSRIEHNFDNNPLCPHCQSCSVNRWGHHNGRQRYRCNQCLKTFNAFTGTPLKRLRIVDALDRYGTTLCTYAAGSGQSNALRMVLNLGANPELKCTANFEIMKLMNIIARIGEKQ